MVQDESRHILYSRSEKGTIQVYDLGSDGQGMTRVAAVNANSMINSAGNIARYISIIRILMCVSLFVFFFNQDCRSIVLSPVGFNFTYSV